MKSCEEPLLPTKLFEEPKLSLFFGLRLFAGRSSARPVGNLDVLGRCIRGCKRLKIQDRRAIERINRLQLYEGTCDRDDAADAQSDEVGTEGLATGENPSERILLIAPWMHT